MITLGLADSVSVRCPEQRGRKLSVSLSTRRMLKSIGAFNTVGFTEVVRISKGLLKDVPLYMYVYACTCTTHRTHPNVQNSDACLCTHKQRLK